MKTPIWTKSDAKRAEKMGWGLCSYIPQNSDQRVYFIETMSDRFKSDDEAIGWVLEAGFGFKSDIGHLGTSTCRKALFLCARG